jgi:DNA-binding LacI/PurR family transcriptional regulator
MQMQIDKAKRIPIYLQCAQVIRDEIEQGRFVRGEFLPSERELSRMFGINRLTLRKGLAQLTDEGLLESVQGAGNRIVEKRNPERTRTVGYVVLRRVGVPAMSPYYADIFDGIEEELTRQDYEVVFSTVRDEDLWTAGEVAKPCPQVVKEHFAGVLLVGGITDELVQAYQDAGIPVVLADKFSNRCKVASIVPDNRAGGYLLGHYLLELGHRRFAFLAPSHEDPVVEARRAGLERALKEAGLVLDKRWYIEGDYEVEPANRAMHAHLNEWEHSDHPTVLVAINDEAAIGAIKALQERGFKVPEEVSVAGFDDISWAEHVEPALTTVRIPRKEMGRWAALELVKAIKTGRLPDTHRVMPVDVVVRNSCASPEL